MSKIVEEMEVFLNNIIPQLKELDDLRSGFTISIEDKKRFELRIKIKKIKEDMFKIE